MTTGKSHWGDPLYPATTHSSVSTIPEVRLGNTTRGFADGTSNNPGIGEGFDGSIAEFTILGFDFADDTAIENYAKFLYEAQSEGAYHLHSGTHSASPRLTQLDNDRDSVYPQNFTLENYTRGAYETGTARVLRRSTNNFTEGYNSNDSGYVYKENASQYYIQSSGSINDPKSKILPHKFYYYCYYCHSYAYSVCHFES